jgi:hypothetical protein
MATILQPSGLPKAGSGEPSGPGVSLRSTQALCFHPLRGLNPTLLLESVILIAKDSDHRLKSVPLIEIFRGSSPSPEMPMRQTLPGKG